MTILSDEVKSREERAPAVPPRERTVVSKLAQTVRRAKAKSGKALVRTIMLRSWPLSTPVRWLYAQRQRPERLERINRRSKQILGRHATALDEYQKRSVRALESEGIHISQMSELLAYSTPLSALQQEAERWTSRRQVQAQIVRRKSRDGAKWYVIRAFGGTRPRHPLTKQLADVVLNERLLGVVNGYLGLCCRLSYVDLWKNLPVSSSEPHIDSEYWHRDNIDRRIVKLFVYLNDVDQHNGPLQFLRRTQTGGEYGSVFPAHPPEGSYPNERALLAVVPESQMQSCTGPAGTVILCDTSGFHKGGRCHGKQRLLLTATYVSDAAYDFIRYQLNGPEEYARLGPMGQYAIRTSPGSSAME